MKGAFIDLGYKSKISIKHSIGCFHEKVIL